MMLCVIGQVKSRNCCFILILMMCGNPSLRVNPNYLFIRILKQRMIEESDNNCLTNLDCSNRYSVYKL